MQERPKDKPLITEILDRQRNQSKRKVIKRKVITESIGDLDENTDEVEEDSLNSRLPRR
jgi:hypothetical protein